MRPYVHAHVHVHTERSMAEARDLPARQAPRVQLRVLLPVPRQRARRVDDEQADAVELYP